MYFMYIIWKYAYLFLFLGDCIYTPLEVFSYYSGVISIFFYFIGEN